MPHIHQQLETDHPKKFPKKSGFQGRQPLPMRGVQRDTLGVPRRSLRQSLNPGREATPMPHAPHPPTTRNRPPQKIPKKKRVPRAAALANAGCAEGHIGCPSPEFEAEPQPRPGGHSHAPCPTSTNNSKPTTPKNSQKKAGSKGGSPCQCGVCRGTHWVSLAGV